jgi:hypothetical protein
MLLHFNQTKLYCKLLKFMKSKDKEICTLDSDLFGVRHYYLLSVKVMWENV